MPCYDNRPNLEAAENKQALDQYAKMCCAHCNDLEKSGNSHLITGQMRIWWDMHKKWDKQRKG